MKCYKQISVLFFSLVILSCSETSQNDLIQKAEAPLLKGLGSHNHKITSNVDSQTYFNQGLILSFAFNHAESIRSFKASQKLDPTCAMCYWGEALSRGPNINVTSDGKVVMSAQDRKEAYKAVGRAKELMSAATTKEQDYILALSSRYNGEIGTDRSGLDRNYALAMESLYKKYPDDMDAASLYAESLMNTMPWNYWTEDGNPKPDTVKVINTLEAVLQQAPNHPLAIHLYIHAVEASSSPERAEAAADRLGSLVPGAGHLVHMPAHIYWRVGRYHDASKANIEAAKVDEEYIAQCNAQGFYPALYYPHNIHFLWAASTMEGRSQLSIDSAFKVAKYVGPEQIRQFPVVEFFHTVPLLSYVRFGKWDEILSYEAPAPEFKYSLGIYHYARGMALSALGRNEEALDQLNSIKPLIETKEIKALVKAGQPSAKLLMIADNLLLGQIEYKKKNYDSSIALHEKAVDLQDELPYTEPPFWYYPTRQSLGRVLMEAGKFKEAEAVFKRDLEDYPRNGWSMFGLIKVLEIQEKNEEAKPYKAQFDIIWQLSDIKLESSVI